MAIVRNQANTLRKGRVGQDTFYVSRGRQIVRQGRNNSNYGDTATRSQAMQYRRSRWGNLVNCYKALQPVLQKAYETKKPNQSFYNRFMQLNMTGKTPALTKVMCEQGFCVGDFYTIAQGSLPSVGGSVITAEISGVELNALPLDLVLTSHISNETLVKDLSAEIIANNPDFENGDALGFVAVVQEGIEATQATSEPRLRLYYSEFVLDTDSTNTDAIAETPWENQVLYDSASGKNVLFPYDRTGVVDYVGLACIHVKQQGGQLKVSTENLDWGSVAFMEDFSENAAWSAECMESYGVDADVPLDPSFIEAAVTRILYNGSVIYTAGQAATAFEEAFDVGGELVIEGRNLTANNFHLAWNDGTSTVMYTPLASTPSSLTYIITSDGTAALSFDGRFGTERLGTIEISGIEPPAGFPTRLSMVISNEDSFPTTGRSHLVAVEGVCLNYTPYMANSEQSYRLALPQLGTTIVQSDFEPVNATIIDFGADGTTANCVLLSVTDATKPAWLYYQGVIIAIFNYE